MHQNPTPSKLIDILPDLSLKCAITSLCIPNSTCLEIGITPSTDFSTNIDADVIDALVGVARAIEQKRLRERQVVDDKFDSEF